MSTLAVAVVALGLLFLHVFYRAAEVQWPSSYYAIGRDLDRRISSNPLAYLLFRFAPVWLAAVFCSVVLRRSGEPVVLPMLMLCLLHAGATTIRAFVALIRSGQFSARPLVAATHLVITVGVVIVGAIAAATSATLDGAVPPSDELTTALWTALMASVVGAYLVKVTRTDSEDTYDALERSRRTIPDHLWFLAAATATEVDSEERLVQAFLLVENLQRPSWVRRAERVGGRLFSGATYGPLQVRGMAPARDEAAIEEAIRTRFAGQRVPIAIDSYGYESRDYTWLRLFALAYNSSSDFASNIEAAYNWLDSPRRSTALASSAATAADRLPLIEVHAIQRRDGRLSIAGTAVVFEGNLFLDQMDGGGTTLRTDHTTASAGGPARGTFSTTIDPVDGAVTVELSGEVIGEEDPTTVASQRVRIPVGIPTVPRSRPISP